LYMNVPSMYSGDILFLRGSILMPTTKVRAHKHFQLDAVKIKRAQKILQAATETETIERALDLAIAEHRSNRLALAAHDRFEDSGIEIKDVYGTLRA
jgi:hypothetical protein